MRPSILYCHGFASSPSSRKAVALAARFEALGAPMQRLDLRLPSFAHLRVEAMIAAVVAAIDGEAGRAIVFGSSLGGLTAARAAARDPRVVALVLMAPAFDLARRWRERLGAAAFAAWERDDALVVDDLSARAKATVDFGFMRDLERLDREGGVLPTIAAPTLIVHGVRDEVVGIESSRALAAKSPDVRLVEVDDDHELAASIPRIGDEAERFLAPWLG